ncbi:TolC family protein [Pedobacter frigiditerrae]|uniref:TolC family protein n=1 Tax=Pedobacter frigiditerrae TaxID=2530452 RepID=UPI00292E9B50|nr:TolC family protein [Pedobacter frigiditerrae]
MKQVANSSFLTKLSFILSLTIVTSMGQKVFAQEVITLQQAVDKTLTNNLQIKQSKLSESLAEETLNQSKLALYPTLNGSVNSGLSFGQSRDQNTFQVINQKFTSFSSSLNAGVDVFQGFQKINQIKQNKILLDAGKSNTEKVKNDLILQVVTSYLQVLYNKDFLKAAQDQLTVARQQLNQQQQLLDVGNKTLADLSQSKSQVATAELNVTNATNALSISYITLAQLMDIPSSTAYEVQAPVIDSFKDASSKVNAEEIYKTSAAQFPDLKLAGLNTAAAKKGIDISKGNYYPRLSFGGGLQTSYSDPSFPTRSFADQLNDRFGQNIGLSLSIPIFNGFTARSSVRRARINLMQTETQEQLAKNNLNKVIYQAVADLKAAESRYESTGNAFTAQKDAFYVIEQRYAVGLVNSLDYSTAQTNRNKAEIDYIQAKYDLIFRAKVIDYYLGKQITF